MLNKLNRQQQTPINPMQLLNAGANGNPQKLFDNMMRTNPQFAQFVNQCRGKSIEQIAREYNVDLNVLNKFIR